jgi:type IV pilus assembly protein PilB
MHALSKRMTNFGKTLIESEILTEDQWDEVVQEYTATDKSLERIMVEKGFISAKDAGQLLELFYGIPYIRLSEQLIDREALDLISEDYCRQARIVPISVKDNQLTLAVMDPDEVTTLDALKSKINKDIQLVLASEDDIIRTIDLYYTTKLQADKNPQKTSSTFHEPIELPDEEKRRLFDFSGKTPVVQLVNDILIKAIRANASDIHIEPTREALLVRFRIDGVLRVFLSAPLTLHPGIVSRIKIMSGMDITERRHPQDGRAEIKARDRIIDLRVSTVPLIFGEKVTIRVLDKKLAILNLEQLGFYEDNLKKIYELLKYSHGMLVISGPTGSGKTSTGYSICNRLKTTEKHLISIEDPVEYLIEDVSQIQVNHEIGLTFSKVLRSILRQDPDIILVGEIRDAETADIAVHAALTGHLVISTLHTNDSISVIVRLIDMGIPPYVLSASIRGVIAQRLVRKICPKCKKAYLPKPGEWESVFGLDHPVPEVIYRGTGCDICFQTGYFGRTVIAEVLTLGDKLRQTITTNPDISLISRQAKEEGLITLMDEAAIKVGLGITTLEEIARVNVGG